MTLHGWDGSAVGHGAWSPGPSLCPPCQEDLGAGGGRAPLLRPARPGAHARLLVISHPTTSRLHGRHVYCVSGSVGRERGQGPAGGASAPCEVCGATVSVASSSSRVASRGWTNSEPWRLGRPTSTRVLRASSPLLAGVSVVCSDFHVTSECGGLGHETLPRGFCGLGSDSSGRPGAGAWRGGSWDVSRGRRHPRVGWGWRTRSALRPPTWLAVSVRAQPLKLHTVTATLFCLSKTSHYVQPTLKGRGRGPTLWQECPRTSGRK